jgi:hypothetical protein
MVVVQVLVEIIQVMLADLVEVVMGDIQVEVDLLHIHQPRVMPVAQEILIIPQKNMLVVEVVVPEAPDKLGKLPHQQILQDLVDWVFNFQQHSEIQHHQ